MGLPGLMSKKAKITQHTFANFYNAFHACDLPQSLDHCLQCLAVALNEVKLMLVLGNSLSLTRHLKLCDVALLDEAQDCNETCLEIYGIKTNPWML